MILDFMVEEIVLLSSGFRGLMSGLLFFFGGCIKLIVSKILGPPL